MKDLYLPEERYIAALKRIREQISEGSALISENSNEIGNKCSWGLCSDSYEQWPDKEDHLYPEVESVKYLSKGQHCPSIKIKI